jgi:hypothetical protein
MKQLFTASLIALALAAPLAAQAPKGWLERVDRSTSAADPDAPGPIKFVAMGTGFHATTPQAAVFWNPANTIAGAYSLKGTFVLQKPSGHTNYYGLVFGGADLGAAGQNYIYFLVAQDGTFIVKHRAGEQTHDVQPATKNAAVKQPGADGKSTNALEVRVAGNTISYVVNGTVVHTTPKSGMTAKTDGIVGVRVNHLLDVHVDGFTVTKG